MIPTHKDLLVDSHYQAEGIPGWCFRGTSHYSIFGTNNKEFGHISYYGGKVIIYARLFNKKISIYAPLKSATFNFKDYIPEWEQLMDDLLKTIFK